MDSNSDGYLDLRELVNALGMSSCSESTRRLRLLFLLHQPPLVTPQDVITSLRTRDQVDGEDEEDKSEGIEEAAEAVSFFDAPIVNAEGDSTPSEEFTPDFYSRSVSISSNSEAIDNQQLIQLNELRAGLLSDSHRAPENTRWAKKMSQPCFLDMWNTLYDMLENETEVAEIHDALATIGTLLLKLGGVSKIFFMEKDNLEVVTKTKSTDQSLCFQVRTHLTQALFLIILIYVYIIES